MKLRYIHLFLSALLLTILWGCSDTERVNNQPPPTIPPTEYTFVHFDPASGNPAALPLPNSILQNPFTGRVSLPSLGDPVADALIAQANTLSGFSTSGQIRIPFTGKVNADTVSNNTILVLDLVDLAAAGQGAQVNPVREMAYEVRADESGENSIVFGVPVRPLLPGRTHIVIITQGVIGTDSGLPVESESLTILLKGTTSFLDGNGNSTRSSLDNATATALEPLRIAYQQIWGAAELVTGQDRLSIPFAYAFGTQRLHGTLTELRARAQVETPTPTFVNQAVGAAGVNAVFNLFGLGAVPHDQIGALYLGTVNAPSYISDPLNGPFQGTGASLQEVGREDINYLAALPAGPGPFPVMIFQHGITSVKEAMFLLANTYCSQGIAVIGIDLVLHGERAPDLIDNTTGAPGPDGVRDPSGTNFINLANLLVSRDNVRQSVSDLFILTRMITSGQGDLNQDGALELSPNGVSFLGMSLGGIVGGSFVALEPNVATATLNVAGGRLLTLLTQSATFGPQINAGLAQFGLAPGTPLYDLYLMFGQAITDDADPINYAPHILSGSLAGDVGTTILMQEMIGDQVVPNSATEDLARAMGIDQMDAAVEISGLNQVASPIVGSALFQYEGGNHATLLDLTQLLAVAVQTQAVFFHATSLAGAATIINPFTASKMPGADLKLQTVPVSDEFEPNYKHFVRFPQK